MPVTQFQAKIAKILSVNRRKDSYLAGGAALHFEPNSIRFSQDLDYFHDSDVRVTEAFSKDSELLKQNSINVTIELQQPGYIRVIARLDPEATKIEWSHDSAWRFMPTYFVEDRGFVLHPIDLAVNKVLALAGRHEARDYLDVIHADETILPLSGLIWAACGKDPGFTPNSLLELLQRKGRFREDDFKRLKLTAPVDPIILKTKWTKALDGAKNKITTLSDHELGCLYFDSDSKKFVMPDGERSSKIIPHFATKGGVLPEILDIS